jgi:hypothetical protein
MLRWLLKSLLILAVFVPIATALPVASVWLCWTPWGGQILFWIGPWSCCFWALILSVLVGSRFWRGRGAVLVWRAERGGYIRSCFKSTWLMFLALFASYACEFAYILLVPPSPAALRLLPLATYAPAGIAALWGATIRRGDPLCAARPLSDHDIERIIEGRRLADSMMEEPE